MINIRNAEAEDASTISRFLHLLAEHDGHGDQCHITETDIHRYGFSPEKCFEVIILEVNDIPQGLALYFMTFSAWQASRILFLSDLFVSADCRGLGLGKKLFSALAKIALDQECCRMDWQVLPGAEATGFYQSLGAQKVEDFLTYSLEADGLKDLSTQV